MRTCDAPDCSSPHLARGYCKRHLQRWYKRGHLQLPSEEDRFWAKVDTTAGWDGCWLWLAATAGEGYGVFTWGERQSYAHRYAYERFREPIPEGLAIDHLCCTRLCVNPRHLEPVTAAENNRRTVRRGRGRWGYRRDRSPVVLEGTP